MIYFFFFAQSISLRRLLNCVTVPLARHNELIIKVFYKNMISVHTIDSLIIDDNFFIKNLRNQPN